MLFCLAAAYFVDRGPRRANGSVNSYDFASIYGAARCWLRGEDPYDMQQVIREVHAAGDSQANADVPASVYLPTAFPVVASVAWLPWKAARLAWSLLSIAVFLLSGVLIFRHCSLVASQKWVLGAVVLLFSPTSSGLSTGNPSVISCALTLAAIFLALDHRVLAAAILLGLAHAIKPQISIAGLAILLVWGYWQTAGLSFAIPVLAACASFLQVASFDRYWLWLTMLRADIAYISLPAALNDSSPANSFSYHLVNEASILSVWLHDDRTVAVIAWGTIAVLAGFYLWRRRRINGDTRLRDIAFFCPLVLIPVYHRYYDAQLLLGIVPFLFANASKATVALAACLLVLLFPLQAILATALPGLSPTTVTGFLLLRHQPSIVILLCVLLIPWRVRLAEAQCA